MFEFPSTLVELFARALQDTVLTVHVHQPGFFHPSTRSLLWLLCGDWLAGPKHRRVGSLNKKQMRKAYITSPTFGRMLFNIPAESGLMRGLQDTMTVGCNLLTVHSCIECRSVAMSGHMCFLHQNPVECINAMQKFSSCIIFLSPFPSAFPALILHQEPQN